jgi:hypothetical protein
MPHLAYLATFVALVCLCAPVDAVEPQPKSLPAAGAKQPVVTKPYDGPACTAPADDYFTTEVWAKVGAQSCLTCHKEGGDAEETRFVLRDPRRATGPEQIEVLKHNRNEFAEMARLKEADKSRMLLKAAGGLDHGGSEVLKPDSTGYRILAEFVHRVEIMSSGKPAPQIKVNEQDIRTFFAGVVMLDDKPLLRRLTLSLAGRLPTKEEYAKVASTGRAAIPVILDGVMKEPAFYTRLREGFNDIFLTTGFDDSPETTLPYAYFGETRGWNQKFDFKLIKDPKEKTQAGYRLSADYRKALLGEPMKLIEHIVSHDRPFTEIITADYIMVTPFSARGYGIYDELKDKFQQPEDPQEYIPVKLKSLKSKNKQYDQESVTGFYPHAGILSTFQYLRRYPTTETNRNRLRSRMYYLHFLGVDALELAARVSDAAAVTAKYEIPTMQASECVVCHRTLDPVASLFQDYYKLEETFGRRKDGWYKDMFQAGFEGDDMPAGARWRALQWLGEQTVKDPRFASAMVEHVYYILTGRKTLLPPKELDDPLYAAKSRAYQAQRREVEEIAYLFTKSNFNLKTAFKAWALSDFYRADGLAVVAATPERQAELNDIGLVRMLGPEQLERKIAAVFGEPWNRLTDQMAMLYGGIDTKEVTERAADPSGAMGAIQRIMANDVACKQTLKDFTRPAAERRLFPGIEPSVVPYGSIEGDEAIHRAIVYLHERILGRIDAPDSKEVDRTFELFAGIVADAHMQKSFEKRESYYCRRDLPEAVVQDPNYTIRAWRGVVTYLLRRQEFLYE